MKRHKSNFSSVYISFCVGFLEKKEKAERKVIKNDRKLQPRVTQGASLSKSNDSLSYERYVGIWKFKGGVSQ